jgi:hypothetical protein
MRDRPIGALASMFVSREGMIFSSLDEKAFKSAPAQNVPASPHNTPTLASGSFSNAANACAEPTITL